MLMVLQYEVLLKLNRDIWHWVAGLWASFAIHLVFL